jgi:hypothetical protein
MNFEIRDDHIGVFDNFFGEKLCNDYIKYYEELDKSGFIKIRQKEKPHVSKIYIDDSGTDLIVPDMYDFGNFNITYHAAQFNAIFWSEVYSKYVKKYEILNFYDGHNIFSIRLQKTKIGQGYHTFHVESNTNHSKNRIAVFMLYLNDVEEGGETEFLYQKTRFKPKKDRLLIWPSTYTYLHRGNPPLSNDKYIITGWVEFGN